MKCNKGNGIMHKHSTELNMVSFKEAPQKKKHSLLILMKLVGWMGDIWFKCHFTEIHLAQ